MFMALLFADQLQVQNIGPSSLLSVLNREMAVPGTPEDRVQIW